MPTDIKRYILSGIAAVATGGVFPYYSVGKPLKSDIPDYEKIEVEEVEPFSINVDKRSMFGTYIWSDILLKYGDVEVYFDTVLFNISQSKNIVKTAISGRNGTFKEYISDGDYMVDIRAALVGKDKGYPESEIRELVKLLQEPAAIEAVSPLLQVFDIYSLVVESYQLPSQNGFTNMQLIELNCISDSPIELIQDDTTN